jgi:arabinogalactan endo-1,4-beta-galactosidase
MVLPLADFDNLPVEQAFIAGADMSHLVFFEERGIDYRVDGDVRDALALLRERGVNCVRLRLFTSSDQQAEGDPYNYTNNLSYTLPLAVRVKEAGMKFMLDFHYSDTWADPGKQAKPADWAALGFADLAARVRAYTSNTVAALNAAGAMPDYVQLGNEITPGMLWNDGRVGGTFDRPTQWQQLAELLKNAAAGVHDAAGANMPKLLIHIAAGGDWGATRWYFDNLEAHHVPFDIIAQSYYPWWHGSPDALHHCLTNTAARYGRPIMVAETAFPWAGDSDIYGYPATPQGQVDFSVALAEIVMGVPEGKGIGIIWWGTEYQAVPGYNLASFNQRSFFDADGNVLPVATAFGQMTAPVTLSVQRQGDELLLLWPLSGAGMLPHATTHLPAAPPWEPLDLPTGYTGFLYHATSPSGVVPRQIYRLQIPAGDP